MIFHSLKVTNNWQTIEKKNAKKQLEKNKYDIDAILLNSVS